MNVGRALQVSTFYQREISVGGKDYPSVYETPTEDSDRQKAPSLKTFANENKFYSDNISVSIEQLHMRWKVFLMVYVHWYGPFAPWQWQKLSITVERYFKYILIDFFQNSISNYYMINYDLIHVFMIMYS